MTPKEKAKELVEKFKEVMPFTDKKLFYSSIEESKSCIEIVEEVTAKQCALIAVDNYLNDLDNYMDSHYHNERWGYWQEVKQEIENL